MNIQTIFVLLLASITFGSSQTQSDGTQKTSSVLASEISNNFTINDKDYTLKFHIEKMENQKAVLKIAIELHNGAYYVSPFAKRDFTGKFYMDLGSYKDLSFKGDIIENPKSIEEIDTHPFVNGTINWVRENTVYRQHLTILSENDFEVFGRVQFTIEPRCTFEEIPFALSYKNGELKIIKNPEC